MQVIVLHGEDTEKSYARLKKFIDSAKDRSWEVVYLDGSPVSVKEDLSSRSLFGNERFFILTNLSKLSKEDFIWIRKEGINLPGNLIIYHEGVLTPTAIKNFPKESRVEEYKLPKLLWSFMENLNPGNSKKVLTQFHKIIEREPVEFVFALVSKQFRDLYWVSESSSTLPYPSWKVGKLKAQASKFDKEKLKELIEKLALIDFDAKTGKADLVSSLDLVLLKYLQ